MEVVLVKEMAPEAGTLEERGEAETHGSTAMLTFLKSCKRLAAECPAFEALLFSDNVSEFDSLRSNLTNSVVPIIYHAEFFGIDVVSFLDVSLPENSNGHNYVERGEALQDSYEKRCEHLLANDVMRACELIKQVTMRGLVKLAYLLDAKINTSVAREDAVVEELFAVRNEFIKSHGASLKEVRRLFCQDGELKVPQHVVDKYLAEDAEVSSVDTLGGHSLPSLSGDDLSSADVVASDIETGEEAVEKEEVHKISAHNGHVVLDDSLELAADRILAKAEVSKEPQGEQVVPENLDKIEGMSLESFMTCATEAESLPVFSEEVVFEDELSDYDMTYTHQDEALFEQYLEQAQKGTNAKPGSEDKVLVLATRYAHGLPLWHESDKEDQAAVDQYTDDE